MKLIENDIHVWAISLHITEQEMDASFNLLSDEEKQRANRFHFPQHRSQFIAAHSAVRRLLSNYLGIPPQDIQFHTNEYGKPKVDHTSLYFNLAHSNDLALLACANHTEIGIDLERIQEDFEMGVAKRFFSEKENEQLLSFSPQEQIITFYRIWSRKEAIIKAAGQGLHIPLKSFTVNPKANEEKITLAETQYHVLPLAINPEFSAAIASKSMIKRIFLSNYTDQKNPC